MDLIDIIQAESIQNIKFIIESKGIPIDNRWLDYEYLNIALRSNRVDVASFLLEKNCRVNKVTKSSNSTVLTDTPLHHAVALGNLDMVLQLLNKKASIVTANSRGNTPLHSAFILKHEAIVDLLLTFIDSQSTYLNCKNNQGLTHLHIACTRKNESTIRKFLTAGANVSDAVDETSLLWSGFNALHFAANSKSLEAVRALVSYSDIDLKAKNTNGQTPFRLAYKQIEDLLVMLDFLSKNVNDYSSDREYSEFSYFHMACLRNYPRDVKSFIKKGIDVNSWISCNAYPYPYYSPLLFAVQSENDAIIQMLLDNGADVSRLTEQGMTPLHLALYARYRNEEIVNRIYADFDKSMIHADENGLNLLHIACSRNDIDTVNKILDSGKKVNKIVSYKKRDFYRFTPLHFAVKYQHREMVELLIKRGANVNANDDWACGTPLHLAFDAGNRELIEILLKNGADPKALQSCDKKTMFHFLVCKNHDKEEELFDYVELLAVKFGLDVNAKDKWGYTPLHHVCKLENDSKWIGLLLEFGADINLGTKDNDTPLDLIFRKISSENISGCMMLYQHVQKLKALGLSVNDENEKCCEKLINESQKLDVNTECFQKETLERMKRLVQNEITKMKRIKLAKGVSLRDFLLLNEEEASVYVKNETLKKIIEGDNLTKLYPSYAYLIRLQYRMATFKLGANTAILN